MQRLLAPFLFSQKITASDIVILTRILATMARAGIPISRCLEVARNQCEKPSLRLVLSEIMYWLGHGENLSGAISTRPDVFSPLYIGMIQAAETAGDLDLFLSRTADYQERNLKFWIEFKSATTYPLFVLVAAISVVFIMSYFIFPSFAQIFTDLHIPLPWPTRVLLLFTSIITSKIFLLALAGGGLLAYLNFKAYSKTWIGRLQIDLLRYRIPYVGKCWKAVVLVQFLHAFGVLFEAGIPIMTILGILQKSTPSPVLDSLIDEVIKFFTREAANLSEALERVNQTHNHFFPFLVTSAVSVGLETGELGRLLARMSRYYELELDALLKHFLQLIEPFVLVVLGFLVCFIMLSVFMPIYFLVTNFQ